jgi:hypothetical protein
VAINGGWSGIHPEMLRLRQRLAGRQRRSRVAPRRRRTGTAATGRVRARDNLILVSVVMAAGLWLLVAGEQTVGAPCASRSSSRICPRISNWPATRPESVDVRIRRLGGTQPADLGDLLAVLDLRWRPGPRLFHLRQ